MQKKLIIKEEEALKYDDLEDAYDNLTESFHKSELIRKE